jgi:hypothetical protein
MPASVDYPGVWKGQADQPDVHPIGGELVHKEGPVGKPEGAAPLKIFVAQFLPRPWFERCDLLEEIASESGPKPSETVADLLHHRKLGCTFDLRRTRKDLLISVDPDRCSPSTKMGSEAVQPVPA